MRFLTDECVSPTTTQLLRELGHEVLDIKEFGRFGVKDQEIYRMACEEKRVIFTTDKGFRKYNPRICGGIIISAIQPNTPLRYEPRLRHLLTTTQPQKLSGSLIIIEEKRHRFVKR